MITRTRAQTEGNGAYEREIRDVCLVVSGAAKYFSGLFGSNLKVPDVDCRALGGYQPIGYNGEFVSAKNLVRIDASRKPKPASYTSDEYLAIVAAHETSHSAATQVLPELAVYITTTAMEAKADLGAIAVLTIGHDNRGLEVAMRLDGLRASPGGAFGFERAERFHKTTEWLVSYSNSRYEVVTPEIICAEFGATFYYDAKHTNYDPHMNGTAIAIMFLLKNHLDVEAALKDLFSKTSSEIFADLFRDIESDGTAMVSKISEMKSLAHGYQLQPLLRPEDLIDATNSTGYVTMKSPQAASV